MFRCMWFPCFLVAVTVVSRAALGQPSPPPATKSQSPAPTAVQLFKKASPSVVKIIAKDEDGHPIATGSGFVIAATSDAPSHEAYGRWVVTNHHVIQAAVHASVDPPPAEWQRRTRSYELGGGQVNRVIVEDDRADLAVLAALGSDESGLPLADDALPPVGTPVFVISSPEGLKNTLSEGLISGYRDFHDGQRWMQISAPIGAGSSGGPVLTADGKVVGVVVSSRLDGQNLNFAVPVGVLRRLLDGPPVHRPLWTGTSIREEEEHAFEQARSKLHRKVCGDDPVAFFHPDRWDKCQARVQAKAESGDQLALVVRAWDHYRRDPSHRCPAFPNLKRAIKEKPCNDEYLAYFLLGKLTAEPWFCGNCVKHKESLSFDELRRGCYDPAIPLLKKSTQLNRNFSPSFARLADVYLNTERYPEALVAAEFLVALVPNCAEAHLIRGKAFASLGRVSAAGEDFAAAMRLRPNWYYLYDEVARAYSRIDDRKAVDAAARGLALPLPTDDEELKTRQIQRFLLWYYTGLDYERLGDLDGALHAFEEARRLQSSSPFQFPDIDVRIARCRAGLAGDGIGGVPLIKRE